MSLSFATVCGTAAPAEAGLFEAVPGWDDFVGTHPSGHVLQLEGWARLKQRVGWQVNQAVLAGAGGTLQAGALVLQQRRLGLSLGYVPGGPVVDWSCPADVDGMRTALLQCARTYGMHVVKIEPELPDSPALRRQLVRLGFRPSGQTVQPRSTIKVDLAGSDADLLGRMKSKWRYNVRRAQRAGTQVRVGGSADLERLHALMQATGRRQGFAPHAPSYFEAAFEMLPDHLELLLADVEGETVAAVVLALCGGSAWYLWGASSTRHRPAMPNYALHFAAMQRARAAGAGTYDLWGIPDSLGAVAAAMREAQGQGDWPDSLPVDLARLPQRDLWTVYRMKQGFGGRIERRVGAWDLPVDELAWRGYAVAVNLQDQVQPVLSEARRHLRLNLERGGPRGSQPLGSCSDVADPVAWNQSIIGCRMSGWQQSWQAGEAARQVGWSVRRWMLGLGRGRPDHAVQVLLRRLGPSNPVSVAEVRDGPCLDWSGLAETAGVLEFLEHLLAGEDCVGIRISPLVPTNSAVGMSALSRLEANGWRPVAHGRQGVSTWKSSLGMDNAPLSDSGADVAARAGLAVVASDCVNGRHAQFLKDSGRGPGDRAEWKVVLDLLNPMDSPRPGPDGDQPEARLFVVENRHHDPVLAVVAVRLGYRASVQRVVHAGQGANVEQCLLAGRSILAWARNRDCVEVDWGPTLLNAGGSEANDTAPIAEGLGAVRLPMAGTWQKWLWQEKWTNRVPQPMVDRIWPGP
ncbi:MAG: peptidoglycan bridge formation glycyltransferase FemA/FemB family protein [Caldilineaceae bacterium]|nr:peptidoglycan bridge formation glycyltransferase FemA/FemB family protein [Caldilineaceae bacterium]